MISVFSGHGKLASEGIVSEIIICVLTDGTTPMSFLVCAAMIGDSLSVTADVRRSLKKSLEADVAMGVLE